MSRQLLKKSLMILEDESQTPNDKQSAKRVKAKQNSDKQKSKKERLKRLKTQKSEKLFEKLHKNRVKYNYIKDMIECKQKQTKDNETTDRDDKCQSVFTEKDFKEFALSYE